MAAEFFVKPVGFTPSDGISKTENMLSTGNEVNLSREPSRIVAQRDSVANATKWKQP